MPPIRPLTQQEYADQFQALSDRHFRVLERERDPQTLWQEYCNLARSGGKLIEELRDLYELALGENARKGFDNKDPKRDPRFYLWHVRFMQDWLPDRDKTPVPDGTAERAKQLSDKVGAKKRIT